MNSALDGSCATQITSTNILLVQPPTMAFALGNDSNFGRQRPPAEPIQLPGTSNFGHPLIARLYCLDELDARAISPSKLSSVGPWRRVAC